MIEKESINAATIQTFRDDFSLKGERKTDKWLYANMHLLECWGAFFGCERVGRGCEW
jgi:hypothetical protein